MRKNMLKDIKVFSVLGRQGSCLKTNEVSHFRDRPRFLLLGSMIMLWDSSSRITKSFIILDVS